MRIALVQQHATHDRTENLARGLAAARAAIDRGAQVIAFAELAFERFHPQHACAGAPPFELAETIPGPTTDRLSALAREHGVVVIPNLYERDGARTFDTTAVIDADGSLLGVTRMLHITRYEGFYETDYYAPGDRLAPVYATLHGRIGVAICYDRHYPEVMRALALEGAQVVVVPQAGTIGEWPEGLYEAELRVAAFQNGYFTALVNRVGREEVLDFAGESFVCDPDGNVVARASSQRDEVLVHDLDLAHVERSIARRLFLRDRRPEIVGALLGAHDRS
ncbi:MAG TPA: nitrilase-related carbon-nitrogen hydrolase [Nannocystaceae bacterium]|nr:nitrilase-related carbon-nitrogen hydrolase [Nannocystaceae bacterium]